MENQIAKQKTKLPSLDELYQDKGLSAKQNELNVLLNQNPKESWIREHNGIKYIPISIIEYLLTSIFIKWRFEIKEVKLIANSINVVGRLHVLDPISGSWDWNDGTGAAPINTKKGAGANEWNEIIHNSVQMSSPAAESFALKDAAEKFGKIFGKDLNRRDFLSYTNLEGKLDIEAIQINLDQYQELYTLLKGSSLDSEEKDVLYEKLKGFVSLFEFQNLKTHLISNQLEDERTRLRNGEILSMGEIGKAIKNL